MNKSCDQDRNQLAVFTATGDRLVANDGSLVRNLSHLSRLARNKGVVAMTVTFNKSDSGEFLALYTNVRNLSPSHVAEYADKFERGTWIRDYPTIMFDWDGNPANGGHVSESFMNAEKCATQQFVVLLGVDPKAQPIIDRNKVRSILDQMGCIEGLTEVKKWNNTWDGQNFATAASHVFSMETGWLKRGEPDWKQSFAKTHMLESPAGQEAARRLLPLFLQVRALINAAIERAEDDDSESKLVFAKGLRKAQFFIPALFLLSSGKPEHVNWLKKLISGKFSERDDSRLSDAREDLQTIVRSSNVNGRRDTEEVLFGAFTLLSLLYAMDTDAKVLRPPQRWGTAEKFKALAEKNGVKITRTQAAELKGVPDGEEVRLWPAFTGAQMAEYYSHRRTIARHFLG